jgi:glucose/arabinose dehydrogenase
MHCKPASCLRTLAPLAVLLALGCSSRSDAGAKAGQASAGASGARAAAPRITVFAKGLSHPWGLAFLPDGKMLVTERPGRLRIVGRDGALSQPIGGVPPVYAHGEGGLFDVALDPHFASNLTVYLAYAEPGPGGTAGTSVARGRLQDGRLVDLQVIFRQQPKVREDHHFGGRLRFAPDGNLFVGLGERFQAEAAQDLSNTLGKLVRIRPDGSVPPGNPFAGRKGADPRIWSYGNRNIEGIAFRPGTSELWVSELGPLGGDELNRIEPGRNYGWPVVSWGRQYNGEAIPSPPIHPEFVQPAAHWTPVISPSGMTFYTGAAFPAWRGDALIAGLSCQCVVRVELSGDRVTGQHRIAIGQRVRDVAQGPDGSLYLLTDEDDGQILRLTAK